MNITPSIRRRRPALTQSLIIGTLLALASCRGGETAHETHTVPEAAEAQVEVRIHTSKGEIRRLTSELAVTDEAQQRGLSGRTSLAADAAMLFPFPYPKMASFWMKDTRLPLDLLFIRSDGTIAEVLHGEPESLQPIAANEPVAAVLEMNRGRAEALGIAPGNRVEWGNCDGTEQAAPVWQADRLCPSPTS